MQSGVQRDGLQRPVRLPQRKRHVHANVGAENIVASCVGREELCPEKRNFSRVNTNDGDRVASIK
jgi:hypothetical protein